MNLKKRIDKLEQHETIEETVGVVIIYQPGEELPAPEKDRVTVYIPDNGRGDRQG